MPRALLHASSRSMASVSLQQQEQQHNQTACHKWTVDNWREHPDLNPTLSFPTWAVPLEQASILQTMLSSELLQPYLATRNEILQLCHPRPAIVQNGNGNGNANPTTSRPLTHKYIMLHESALQQPLPPRVQQFLNQHNITEGPTLAVAIRHHQLPLAYILDKLLPADLHPTPTAFETVGHVAHLNLRDQHLPYAPLIGHVLLETLKPSIQTVLAKVGQVGGPYRTYDYQVLAGRNHTTVNLTEHGLHLQFNLAQVYWSSRLAQERQVLLQQEIKPHQIVADAFCGVGAMCLLAARDKNCTILANDWNVDAIQSFQQNFVLNRLERHLAATTHQDAYEFLMDLGLPNPDNNNLSHNNKGEPSTSAGAGPATTNGLVVDHVIMNFPLKAPSFLGALRWWSPPLSRNSPRIHVYTFARADPKTRRSAQDVAIDQIASELLPIMGLPKSDDDDNNGKCHRRQELDNEYGCQVVAREVRDVAPGKLVFCVSFTATSKLLRHMQGDFD